MSIRITDFPQDVLLELAKKLDVADLFGFLSICRVIQVENHPLPDLHESWSLLELQGIVRQANRLMKNFKTNNPRPVLTRTFGIPLENGSIILIRGTSLFVTHGPGSVSRWDILTSQRVGHLEMPKLLVKTEQAFMESPGKALLGGCIGTYETDIQCLVVNSRILGYCANSAIISWSLDASVEVKEVSQEFIHQVRTIHSLHPSLTLVNTCRLARS
ncbi:hypothetical protein MVEN_02190100 [Mycena venus]|uniref:F-box domain-containing protein n=1 Tax=Mycena venus TaxID=2733690 RepID=A0A8H6X785_9AGAR|nr:hypothetical protein MVEN_02190100 [Mycena venus]